MKYLINPLKRLFDFTGRANRKEFWLFMCWYIVLMVASWFPIMFLCMIIGTMLYSDLGSQQGVGWIGAIICIVGSYLGAILLPLSLRTRRLHDIGMSGWWQLLLFVPYLGGLALFICMLLPGTEGENRFGEQPR